MDRDEIRKYITGPDISIIQAMELMDINGEGILFVVQNEGVLIASVTDGDVRRWLLRSGDLNAKISYIMNKQPRYLKEGYDINPRQYMSDQLITAVPVLDCNDKIVDVLLGRTLAIEIPRRSDALSGVSVVVMAGGKGTRLLPYTRILPKPLIPVGNIPILERILDRFEQNGAEKIYTIVNYKKDMIKAYFSDIRKKYKISFVDETIPLGTAGGIRLIQDKLKENVLISNCDILVRIDYEELMKHHSLSGNDMTIVTSMKSTRIPYGVVSVKNDGIIANIKEKPQISHFINTGMYVVKDRFIEWIPNGEVYHMTDLAKRLIKDGRKVGMFPISENSFWDMGEFGELERMEERLKQGDSNG